MKFSATFLAVTFAALAATTEACKCVLNGNNYPTATQPCCSQLSGDYNNGDCAAGSISEHLSNFRSCCHTWLLNNVQLTSDCDFPKQAVVDTVEVEGEVVQASA